jgi:hypothetical protein
VDKSIIVIIIEVKHYDNIPTDDSNIRYKEKDENQIKPLHYNMHHMSTVYKLIVMGKSTKANRWLMVGKVTYASF